MNASERGYYAKLNLCNDIERNPGSSIHNIDPTLTIKVPYSQWHYDLWWKMLEIHCLVMSLIALVYNNIKGIDGCDDLVQTMEIDNL